MKRVVKFTDAMHNAFTRPLVTEDSYKDAMRLHIFAALSNNYEAECYDSQQLEIYLSYGFLIAYAEYRSGRITDPDQLTEFFVSSFIQFVANESIDEEEEVIGDEVFIVTPQYCLTLPGIQGTSPDTVVEIITQLGCSVVDALVNNGNIPTYFDLAFGYQYGETVALQGNDCFDTIMVFDDSKPTYGQSFIIDDQRLIPDEPVANDMGRGLTMKNSWATIEDLTLH